AIRTCDRHSVRFEASLPARVSVPESAPDAADVRSLCFAPLKRGVPPARRHTLGRVGAIRVPLAPMPSAGPWPISAYWWRRRAATERHTKPGCGYDEAPITSMPLHATIPIPHLAPPHPRLPGTAPNPHHRSLPPWRDCPALGVDGPGQTSAQRMWRSRFPATAAGHRLAALCRPIATTRHPAADA